MADRTLIISTTGVIMSGIVGPSLTAWATRVSQRKQFLRDREEARRDELLAVCDEAATLLAAGPTRIRESVEHLAAGRALPPEAQLWSDRVFAIEQRLVLRLGPKDPIVVSYEAVRVALAEALEVAVGSDDAQRKENAVLRFEAARDGFFKTTKEAMLAPVSEKERKELTR